MRWSRGASAAAAAIALTLGIKAAVLAHGEPVTADPAYIARLAQRLRGAGFAIERIDDDGYVIASRGQCRLKARELAPMGTERGAFERLGAAFGPTRYAWRGDWSAAPPKYRPLLTFYAQRELARIGIPVTRRAIAAVSAGPACAPVAAGAFDVRVGMPAAAQVGPTGR